MSQLFTRLAERATLTAPVLERRARSLFEPARPTGPEAYPPTPKTRLGLNPRRMAED